MASGQYQELKYVAESTEGTTPASALTILNHESLNTGEEPVIVTDNSVHSGGFERPDIRGSDGFGNLDFSSHLRYGEFDDFLAAMFRADWTAAKSETGTDISAAATGLSSSTTDLDFGTGAGAYFSGFTTNGSGFLFANSTSGTAFNVTAGEFDTLSTEGAGDSVTVMNSGTLTPGTTNKFMSLEVENTDISNNFLSRTGWQPNRWTLSMSKSDGKWNVGFAGKSIGYDRNDATIGTGADIAANTNGIFGTQSQIAALVIDGTVVTNCTDIISGLNLEMTANLQERDPAGTDGPCSQSILGFGVTVSVDGYYGSALWRGIVDSYHDQVVSDIGFVIRDAKTNSATTNAYLVYLPEVSLQNGTGQSGSGNRNDITGTINAKGVVSVGSALSGIHITRFATYG